MSEGEGVKAFMLFELGMDNCVSLAMSPGISLFVLILFFAFFVLRFFKFCFIL